MPVLALFRLYDPDDHLCAVDVTIFEPDNLAGAKPRDHVMHSLGDWTSLWIVADCGDRLQRLLDGGHEDVEESEFDEDEPILEGASCWSRSSASVLASRGGSSTVPAGAVVTHLHPDLAYGEAPEVRSAREEALKRVNAAYDRLRAA